MRTIKITASQKTEFVDTPYLFNVKEKARISMDLEEIIISDKSEKIVLTCALEPTFSEEQFMKTLRIIHDGKVLWTHNYTLYAQSTGEIPFVAAGGRLSTELSQIRQVYHMLGSTECWSKEECESRLRNNPFSLPACDDRSLVTMIEAGGITHQGLQSISIRRIEPDSRFCDITFS